VGAGADALTDGGPHGGWYSQDDIREIGAYAADRFVTVVPEIDSPGHVQAAIAAYPELGVAGQPLEVLTRWGIDPNVLRIDESTIRFFTDVLEAIGVEYRRNDGPLPWKMRPGVQGRPRDRIRLGEPPLPSAPIQT
jgi:N-acetyl-beta-hexosaminidase